MKVAYWADVSVVLMVDWLAAQKAVQLAEMKVVERAEWLVVHWAGLRAAQRAAKME